MMNGDRWEKIGFVLRVMLEEGAYDLARQFIDFLEDKELKKNVVTECEDDFDGAANYESG